MKAGVELDILRRDRATLIRDREQLLAACVDYREMVDRLTRELAECKATMAKQRKATK